MYQRYLTNKEMPYIPYDRILETRYRYHREESTMSLIVGLIGTDGIVLATDSRLILEHDETSEIIDNEKKLFIIDNSIGLMFTSNDLALTKNLSKKAEHELLKAENKSLPFTDKINKVSELLTAGYNNYVSSHFLQVMVDSGGFDMEFIFAGYSVESSKPNIILLASSAKKANFVSNHKLCCISGITAVANYWKIKLKDSIYKKEGDNVIPIQNTSVLRNVAVMIIDESSKASYKIGGKIQMNIIRPNTVDEISSDSLEILRAKIRKTVTNEHDIFEHLQEIE
jgi:20S proteasome alpha/beta subunit